MTRTVGDVMTAPPVEVSTLAYVRDVAGRMRDGAIMPFGPSSSPSLPYLRCNVYRSRESGSPIQ